MNVKKILISVSTLVAVFLTGSASALVIDFAGMADNTLGAVDYFGEGGGQPITLDYRYQTDLGSLVIKAYGYTISGSSLISQHAYLDGSWGGRPAGMGVCQQTNGECEGTSDDNVTWNEVLELHFTNSVTITGISFVNGHHDPTFGSGADFGLSVGNHDPTTFSSYGLTANYAPGSGYSGTDFLFSNTNRMANPNTSTGNIDDYVYYVNAMTIEQVPEPGMLLLVVTGFVGIIAARRRRVQI